MPKSLHKEAPVDYPVCEKNDCPRAAECLHQLAYRPLIDRPTAILRLLNPRSCTADERCPHYRDCHPVTYARGFTGMQSRMFPNQYKRFMSILIRRFSRNPYFMRRRGEMPLSPKEQSIVLEALKTAGVTQPLAFDRYEESLNWYE